MFSIQLMWKVQTHTLLKVCMLMVASGWCWYRQNITDTYPEGTTWEPQQFKVTSLSVGPNNQVWFDAAVRLFFGKIMSVIYFNGLMSSLINRLALCFSRCGWSIGTPLSGVTEWHQVTQWGGAGKSYYRYVNTLLSFTAILEAYGL